MPYFDDAVWDAVGSHEDTELEGPALVQNIADFERIHCVKLPPSHKEFLLRANGGALGLARLFGVCRDDALDFGGQLQTMRTYIEKMAEGPVLPFASSWGGSYFCYDLRTAAETSDYVVLLWNHEYSEEQEYRPYLWSVYADNFVAFIKKMVQD